MKKITLKKLKGIREMEFILPETNHVYLLVGANGAGKSTLLVCLDRICNPYAFASDFKSSRVANIDQYTESVIQYDTDSASISYRKAPVRWAPAPRRNVTEKFDSFGFTGSIFIKADSKRIEPTQAAIQQGRFEAVNDEVKAVLNRIFDTKKYSKLQHLRIPNGRGKPATFFYIIRTDEEQYSEQRFSSGELAIIKLIEQLHDASDNTLVLLDEAEIALHPRVQVNLLNYLKEQSKIKSQMIIISTHSPTMINKTDRKNIILLESDNGNTTIHYECYPAKALGTIDTIENSGFDYHFFVEDLMAKRLLEKMIQKYLKLKPEHITASINITPVGGYRETSKFAIEAKGRIFNNSKVFAVLDADAFGFLAEENQNTKFAQLYEENIEIIYNLGCTPEKMLIDKFEEKDALLIQKIRSTFRCEYIDIANNPDYCKCNSKNERTLAKKKFDEMILILKKRSGKREEKVIDTFVELVIDTLPDGRIQELLSPMFKNDR